MDDDLIKFREATRASLAFEADIRRTEEMRKARSEGRPIGIAFAGIRRFASDEVILSVWDAFSQERVQQFIRDFETEGIPFPQRQDGPFVVRREQSDRVSAPVVLLPEGELPWYSVSTGGSLISMMIARETRRVLLQESFARQILPPLPLDIE
jgi:hypothetical protein